jgi:hypothetical protein
MLKPEMSCIPSENMADVFTNLSKVERIEKAVKACAEDDRLTIWKAAKIYKVAHTMISRRLQKTTQAYNVAHRFQQLLTPVEERTLVKWVIQYYKWGAPTQSEATAPICP